MTNAAVIAAIEIFRVEVRKDLKEQSTEVRKELKEQSVAIKAIEIHMATIAQSTVAHDETLYDLEHGVVTRMTTLEVRQKECPARQSSKVIRNAFISAVVSAIVTGIIAGAFLTAFQPQAHAATIKPAAASK